MPRLTASPALEHVEIQNLYAFCNLTSNAGAAATYAACRKGSICNAIEVKTVPPELAETGRPEEQGVDVVSEWQFVSRWAPAALDSVR